MIVRKRALRIVLVAALLAVAWHGCVADDPHTIVEPTGATAECSAPDDCSGDDSDCRKRACDDGACGFDDEPAGTACDEASGRVCDGGGRCVLCVLNDDCLDPALACSDGNCVPVSCTDGVQSGDETGMDCGGPECPPCGEGEGCLEDADCETSFCDPASICSACTGDADCDPYACSGGSCLDSCGGDADCAGTSYCEGTSCVPKLDDGIACSAPNLCQSGFCSDGVCCDVACAGGCGACDQPSTGTCTLFAQGSAGSPSCTPFLCDGSSVVCPSSCGGDGDCAAGHYCSGATCVTKKTNGTTCGAANECQSGQCVDGVCCNTGCVNACDACNLSGSEGACSPRPDGAPGVPACDPYLCNGAIITCPTSCVSAADCIAGHFCGSNSCLPLEPNGSTCASAAECQSGHCVDGFCCDTACNGSCDQCNAGGNQGTCALRAGGVQGSPSCSPYLCDGLAAGCPSACATSADCVSTHYCDGASQCVPKQGNGVVCALAAECQSGFCADGFCCNSACGSSCDTCSLPGTEGACLPAPPGSMGAPSCSPYVCDGLSAACPSSCASSANCANGFSCDAMQQCVP